MGPGHALQFYADRERRKWMSLSDWPAEMGAALAEIRESQRITAEDLAIVINARD